MNQTLSQSAPQTVILAIRSVAKLFTGDMIEAARKVQDEWIPSDDLLKEEIKKRMEKLPPLPEEVMNEKRPLPRGPIEPDHLREALRRYKAKGTGGLVGELNLWQAQNCSGVERFATKVQGKRLFK